MTRTAAACAIVLSMCCAAQAQQPFDMSPERHEETPPNVPPSGTNGAQPVPAAPSPAGAEAAPAAPPQAQPDLGAVGNATAGSRRNLIPFSKLVLSGEVDRRAWSFYLTAEQAASGATLHLGYQNAILVAPEDSSLEVLVNGASVLRRPVQSSDGISDLTAAIPAGLLRPGDNFITLASSLRHRTDCTVQSTYELWTEIAPSKTYLQFDRQVAQINRLEDLAAVGLDQQGATEFNIVAPALDRSMAAASVIRLAEGVGMTADLPNQSMTVSREPATELGPGRLRVVLGTASEIAPLVPNLPATAATSPISAFVEDPASGFPVLVISGPNWQSLDTAIASVVTPMDRPLTVGRSSLATKSWRTPDAPLFREKGRLTLAELGVPTQEFAGRRFRTDFAFGIPSDFYANEYGEATLLLDAAYSSEVRPGSHIDVYVNSNIAATVPITQAGGSILRHFPVGVTMRHFRPGVNVVAIEAVLMTNADEICAPGTTAQKNSRFVLFDTSQFEMPNFARIARRPNLSGTSGTGFPYGAAEQPAALFVEGNQPQALSAAATLLTRMSVAAGRPVPIDTSGANPSDRNAIFVASAGDIRPEVLAQVGMSGDTAVAWTGGTQVVQVEDQADTSQVFARWREELSGSGWRGRVSALEEWFTQTFDVTTGLLDFLPNKASPYLPGRDVRLVVAQQTSPLADRTWTVVTAPTLDALRDGTRALTTEDNWSQVGGQISTLDVTMQEVGTIPDRQFSFVPTQPFSLANYRLIAANWLSANPLSYAAALFVACCVLGLATASLLSGLGRPK